MHRNELTNNALITEKVVVHKQIGSGSVVD